LGGRNNTTIFDNIDIGDLPTSMLPFFDVRCVHRPNSKNYDDE